jgi:hypothetical protein
MTVVYTPDLGLAQPDLYSDQKETYYADALTQINRILGGYLAVATGDANYTLKDQTGAFEARTLALKFTSTLTAARTISIDTTTSGKYRNRFFIMWNATAGGFKVTIKTTAGGSTGVDISNGKARLVWHDGTNVYAIGAEVAPTTGAFTVLESDLSLSDITTANVSTTKHGFAPKLPNDATKFLDGTGAFTVPAGGTPKGVRAYNSSNISISSSTETLVTLDSERVDDNGFHSTVSNTSRLTVPAAGWVFGIAKIAWGSNVTGYRDVVIYLNGATIIAYLRGTPETGAGSLIQICPFEYKASVSDYFEVKVNQNSGSSINILTGAQYGIEFGLVQWT